MDPRAAATAGPVDSRLDVLGTTPPEGARAEPTDPSVARRAVASGTFGTALEWFDFAVHGTLSATLFPQLFFPNSDENTAILASFATFGAGMAARPLGGSSSAASGTASAGATC